MELNLDRTQKFQRSLQAFNEIDGMDYFPQIHIPYFEHLQELNKKNNGKVLSPDSDPIVIIGVGDSGGKVTHFPGYRLNEEGELEDVGFLIDEEYAQNNEVWVISISDTYFGEELASENIGARTEDVPSALVDKMTCKCHFEDWINGKSEVHIFSAYHSYEFGEPFAEQTYGGSQHEGGKIYDFSRKDVKNKVQKDLNFPIVLRWDDNAPSSPYASFVIFEYDPWPQQLRTVTWTQGFETISYDYRSSDIRYNSATVYKYDFAYYSNDWECMTWNTQYQ